MIAKLFDSARVAAALERFPRSQAKLYTRTYQEAGYEFGFGRPGRYSGHAHRVLWDIVFSPEGFSGVDVGGQKREGRLLVLPPCTYFGDITLGAFCFLKFSGSLEIFALPDKVPDHLCRGIAEVDPPGLRSYDWFPRPAAPPRLIHIGLEERGVLMSIEGCMDPDGDLS